MYNVTLHYNTAPPNLMHQLLLSKEGEHLTLVSLLLLFLLLLLYNAPDAAAMVSKEGEHLHTLGFFLHQPAQ